MEHIAPSAVFQGGKIMGFIDNIKSAFAQRRKTLLNSLSNVMGIDKNLLRQALIDSGYPETVRGEALNLEALANLSNQLSRR